MAGQRTGSWVVVAFAGAVGAAVSVLQRATTFQELRGDRLILVLTGFCKPLIGAAFAMFVFALVLPGGVLPLYLTGDQSPAGLPYLHPMHLALAFLAGFSERFVPDLAGRLEKTYVTKEKISRART